VRSLIVQYHEIEETFSSRCSGDQDGVVDEVEDEEASACIGIDENREVPRLSTYVATFMRLSL